MDWYKFDLPVDSAVSFESRWLVYYSRKGTPRGLFIFRCNHTTGKFRFYVPEATWWAFKDFFRGMELKKCKPPLLDDLQPVGGTDEEVHEFYRHPD